MIEMEFVSPEREKFIFGLADDVAQIYTEYFSYDSLLSVANSTGTWGPHWVRGDTGLELKKSLQEPLTLFGGGMMADPERSQFLIAGVVAGRSIVYLNHAQDDIDKLYDFLDAIENLPFEPLSAQAYARVHRCKNRVTHSDVVIAKVGRYKVALWMKFVPKTLL